MKNLLMSLSLIGIVLLNGACAPINPNFSCNSTAGDKCLSIEEVNAMTEVAQDKQNVISGRLYQKYAHYKALSIWMTDGKGGHYVE